jgi:hypothetical protein
LNQVLIYIPLFLTLAPFFFHLTLFNSVAPPQKIGRKILEGHLPLFAPPPPSSVYECNLTTQSISCTLTRQMGCCVHYPKSTDVSAHTYHTADCHVPQDSDLQSPSPVTALRPLNSLMHKTYLFHAICCICKVNDLRALFHIQAYKTVILKISK